MNTRRLLGFLFLFGGYGLTVFGYSRSKSAYNPSLKLSLSDVFLPSHRAKYVSVMTQAATFQPNQASGGSFGAPTNTGSSGVPVGSSPYPTIPGVPGTKTTQPASGQGTLPYPAIPGIGGAQQQGPYG